MFSSLQFRFFFWICNSTQKKKVGFELLVWLFLCILVDLFHTTVTHASRKRERNTLLRTRTPGLGEWSRGAVVFRPGWGSAFRPTEKVEGGWALICPTEMRKCSLPAGMGKRISPTETMGVGDGRLFRPTEMRKCSLSTKTCMGSGGNWEIC